MEESILKDVKKFIGLEGEYDSFDRDIIMNINASFAVLNQLGVGPDEIFMISGYEEKWSSFEIVPKLLPLVMQYIYLRTRRTFDPPTSSFVLTSLDSQLDELAFRLNVGSDPRGMEEV